MEGELISRKQRGKFICSQSWRFFFSLGAPIILILIFLWKPEPPDKHTSFEQAPYGLYVTCLMACYWVTECIPMPITSLIPIFLIPMFGIEGSEKVCSAYFNRVILFLFAGCVVALSFEYSNLHTRIALFVMKSIGARPSILLLGMMSTCMLLSCWMNNTSTTAMMVPVIVSVMDQYKKKLIPEGTPQELAEKYGNPEAQGAGRDSSSTISHSAESTEVEAPPLHAEGKKEEDTSAPADDQTSWETTVESSMTSVELKEAVTYWEREIKAKTKYVRNIEIMLLIGVAVASNIGGTGVITGTGTNLVATAQLKEYQSTIGKTGNEVQDMQECLNPSNLYWELDFVRWIVLNIFAMLVNTFLAWCFLALYFDGLPRAVVIFFKTKVMRKPLTPVEIRRAEEKAAASASIKEAIKEKYMLLGRTSMHEWLVIIFFISVVFLWILKNPLFLRPKPKPYSLSGGDDLSNQTREMIHPKCLENGAKLKLESGWGWARFFGDKCDEGFIHDYVPTLLICFLMFILPRDPIYYKNVLKGGLDVGMDDPILPLDFVAQNTPWGPLFMLGGGFGLALAINSSGLGAFLKYTMQNSAALKAMHPNAILAIILVLVAMLTSIASNTAVAVIVAPALLSLSATISVPPLYMLVPAIVSASYAFLLPISTPPNAIVYDKGNMRQLDMLIPGFFLTLICNSVLYVFTILWTAHELGVADYTGACNTQLIAPDIASASSAQATSGPVVRSQQEYYANGKWFNHVSLGGGGGGEE